MIGFARYRAAAKYAAYVINVYFMNYEVLCLHASERDWSVVHILLSEYDSILVHTHLGCQFVHAWLAASAGIRMR